MTKVTDIIKKLNTIFSKLFATGIVKGHRDYYCRDAAQAVTFNADDENKIRLDFSGVQKELETCFNLMPNTQAQYYSHTGSFSFTIISSDQFKALYAMADDKLYTLISDTIKKLRAPKANYKEAKQAIAVPAPKTLTEIELYFVPPTGTKLEQTIFIPLSNKFSDWQKNIIDAVKKKFDVTLTNEDIPQFKYRLNGLTPNDLGIAVSNNKIPVNYSIFTDKTFISIRLSQNKCNEIANFKPKSAVIPSQLNSGPVTEICPPGGPSNLQKTLAKDGKKSEVNKKDEKSPQATKKEEDKKLDKNKRMEQATTFLKEILGPFNLGIVPNFREQEGDIRFYIPHHVNTVIKNIFIDLTEYYPTKMTIHINTLLDEKTQNDIRERSQNFEALANQAILNAEENLARYEKELKEMTPAVPSVRKQFPLFKGPRLGAPDHREHELFIHKIPAQHTIIKLIKEANKQYAEHLETLYPLKVPGGPSNKKSTP